MARRLVDVVQCEGKARSGRRCSITSACTLRDDTGRLAGAPLLCGSRYCAFHTAVFCSRSVDQEERALHFFLDFETTGLDWRDASGF